MNVVKLVAGAVGYLVVVFPLAYVWHLVAFEDLYARLGYIGRDEPIIAFGFLAIVVQGLLLSYLYPRVARDGAPLQEGLRFGLIAGIFLWSTQVVAAVAKYEIAPIGTFMLVESAYVAVQFALVGIMLALVYGRQGETARS